MRYLNADGSVGTMCGNGARCLARFAVAAGITASDGMLVFETDAGPHRAHVSGENGGQEPGEVIPAISVDLVPQKNFRSLELEEAGGPIYSIWTGTEHAVVFVDDVQATDVPKRGRRIRRHPALAPAGANVDFVEIRNESGSTVLGVRTFEKGVEAETLACGTGAVAAAAVAQLTGRLPPGAAHIEMPGGSLYVSFADDDVAATPSLTGPADVIFRGTFEW